MSQNSYQLITLSGDIVMAWPSSFSRGPTIYDINDVNATAGGFTITLPNATLVPNGTEVRINNISIHSFELFANDLTTQIAIVASGEFCSLYLYDNSTSNGLWRVISYVNGSAGVNSFVAESTDNSITVTNGSVSNPGGTINFQLPPSLKHLNDIKGEGFAVITNDALNTWTTRSLTAGSNISITNNDGVTSDPVINLDSAITGLTFIGVGDISLTGSAIENVNSNGGITFLSSGTGTLNLNGVTIDTAGNLTVGASFKNAFMPKAWCVFTDTITGGINNTIVIKDSANVASVTGAGGLYTIHFANNLSNNFYGVLITVGTEIIGNLPVIATGFPIHTAQTTSTCQIAVVNASGQYITQATSGITVQILSST